MKEKRGVRNIASNGEYDLAFLVFVFFTFGPSKRRQFLFVLGGFRAKTICDEVYTFGPTFRAENSSRGPGRMGSVGGGMDGAFFWAMVLGVFWGLCKDFYSTYIKQKTQLSQ